MPRWLSGHRRMQCRQTLTVRVWRHRSNAICRQNCRQMDVRPLVAGRKNFELAGEMGGAKGTRTPDPHTASVVRYQLRHSPRCCAHRSYTTACQPSKSLITRRLPQWVEVAQAWRLLAGGDLLGQQPTGRRALLHAPHAVPTRNEDRASRPPARPADARRDSTGAAQPIPRRAPPSGPLRRTGPPHRPWRRRRRQTRAPRDDATPSCW